jgi:hypothetical protein
LKIKKKTKKENPKFEDEEQEATAATQADRSSSRNINRFLLVSINFNVLLLFVVDDKYSINFDIFKLKISGPQVVHFMTEICY